MKPLILPQVNLNGTSREALVEQQMDVLRALQETMKKMLEANPHGRDYQFRPEEYERAKSAWLDRMELLGKLHEEIEMHALAIHERGER